MQRSANLKPRSSQRQETRAQAREWPRRIGLLNDYLRIPFATGSSLATQFLHREFRARGHEVTVVGPDEPGARAEELPERCVALASLPLRMHPGIHLPLPSARGLARVVASRFDLVLGQTATELADLGVWLRARHGIPFLCVNTLYLPGAYNVLLSDTLLGNSLIDGVFREQVIPWLERHSGEVYNQTDGLIVLCRGLEHYWRARGVTAPIHVIPRSVDPGIFDQAPSRDPFADGAPPGARMLCVCRHAREKSLDRLLSLFARHVAPRLPQATLTLVGDGPEHDHLRAQAGALGLGARVFFPGELPVTELAAFYRNADLFVYPSLTETYGQVVSEAMYCGLPVVAFADGMGVSDQIEHGRTSVIVAPGPDAERADREFAGEVLDLLRHPARRRWLGEFARTRTRQRTDPQRVLELYYTAFDHARRHCLESAPRRASCPLVPLQALARWASVQGALAGLGCIRPKVTVNRHGRRQPGWQDLEPSAPSSARSGPAVALRAVSWPPAASRPSR